MKYHVRTACLTLLSFYGEIPGYELTLGIGTLLIADIESSVVLDRLLLKKTGAAQRALALSLYFDIPCVLTLGIIRACDELAVPAVLYNEIAAAVGTDLTRLNVFDLNLLDIGILMPL